MIVSSSSRKKNGLEPWRKMVQKIKFPKKDVSIAIAGKYMELKDSYKSLKEALVHGALAHNLKLRVTWIEAEGLETRDEAQGDAPGKPNRDYESQLADFDGILVPVALSASHIGYSAIRMEPTWSALGQAAGVAAGMTLKERRSEKRAAKKSSSARSESA